MRNWSLRAVRLLSGYPGAKITTVNHSSISTHSKSNCNAITQRNDRRIAAMKFRAILFDAAETLFTTKGSVGEIYGSIARQYGSNASTDAIQAAFARQFRGAGPLSTPDQKQWWKDVVHRVFSEVGMVNNFDR